MKNFTNKVLMRQFLSTLVLALAILTACKDKKPQFNSNHSGSNSNQRPEDKPGASGRPSVNNATSDSTTEPLSSQNDERNQDDTDSSDKSDRRETKNLGKGKSKGPAQGEIKNQDFYLKRAFFYKSSLNSPQTTIEFAEERGHKDCRHALLNNSYVSLQFDVPTKALSAPWRGTASNGQFTFYDHATGSGGSEKAGVNLMISEANSDRIVGEVTAVGDDGSKVIGGFVAKFCTR